MLSREAVQGWFDDERGARLVELAMKAPGAIVEIGTAWGKSISYVLDQTSLSVTCIDIWGTDPDYPDEHLYGGTWEAFNELLEAEGWTDRVTVIRGDSSKAVELWTQPIGLLHIDGDHSYEGALADYVNWSPFVVTGGAIVFDDYTTYREIAAVVQDNVIPSGLWGDYTEVYCQWSATRLKEAA